MKEEVRSAHLLPLSEGAGTAGAKVRAQDHFGQETSVPLARSGF